MDSIREKRISGFVWEWASLRSLGCARTSPLPVRKGMLCSHIEALPIRGPGAAPWARQWRNGYRDLYRCIRRDTLWAGSVGGIVSQSSLSGQAEAFHLSGLFWI